MYHIAVLPGDGIGPEITREAVKVLEAEGAKHRLDLAFSHHLVGGALLDAQGVALSDEVVENCRRSDAVLFGAVGGPKWDRLDMQDRADHALIRLRQALSVYANLRQFRLYAGLEDASAVKADLIAGGVDFIILRELSSGAYYGQPKFSEDTPRGRRAVDTIEYYDFQVERLARYGFELARQRRGKLTSMSKWNALESSRLWRDVVEEVARDYPDVETRHEIVDAGAMNLIQRPAEYDVIVMPNMFGDILGDEAAVLAGSIGMIPSAEMSLDSTSLYEPIHGSANDIEGKNVANPLAMILSAALLLRYSLNCPAGADEIDRAVGKVIEGGYRTADIWTSEDKQRVSTTEMGDLVVEMLSQ
ncbi:MAG: 3-isopropylmalate dehydrogenase [Gemmatimonadetes bacterium]|nr:3-isopropylmalate dehydrogenase [Gemmatimonadota bacterium]